MRYMAATIITLFLFSSVADAQQVVSWEMMKTLNYNTGQMPESLRQVDQQSVEVAGFIVPLEMDEYIDQVKEFLLVPDPMACIHVPPPSPNQIIHVTMAEEIPLDMDFRGVTINGIINISQQDDGFFSFEMSGESAIEANLEFEDPLMMLLYN